MLGYTSPSSTELSAKLASELQEKFNVRILAVQANLSDSTGPSKLVEESKKQFTKPKDDSFTIDIIINNAGVLKMGAVGSIDLEKDLIPSYQVNVFAPLLLVQAALPYLPNDRSGRIINVSSTSSSNGCADQSVYGGTKAALEAMTRTWSRELSERATVVAINPGPVMTDMFQTTSDEFPQGLQPMVELAPLAKIRTDVDGEQVQKDWGPMRGKFLQRPEHVLDYVAQDGPMGNLL